MSAERRYSTSEVARLVQLTERQVRGYVRAGVLEAGREEPCPSGRGRGRRLRFEFRDILVLKAARRLLAAGIPPPRVERGLALLRAQLPADKPLSSVRIDLDGGQIVVSDGDVNWEAETGQTHLSFEPRVVEPVAQAPKAAPALVDVVRGKKLLSLDAMTRAGDVCSADGWFDAGLDIEMDNPDRAYESYLAALACDPEHVEAMINIGRLCSEAGDDQRAAAYFRQATRVDPAHPVAHFNHAVTMHDHGAFDSALASYKAALIHDPEFADAHFNLAALLEEMGDLAGAREHMEAYRAVLEKHPR